MDRILSKRAMPSRPRANTLGMYIVQRADPALSSELSNALGFVRGGIAIVQSQCSGNLAGGQHKRFNS